jgi:cytochrome P450 / NADPH-cytochrome P450 reductase
LLAAGRSLAPALLFFGCRSPDRDMLYRVELERWERLGAVEIRHAFSRAPEQSEDCRHVQDRLHHDREDVERLWNQGAKVFICGSREVGKGVEDVCVKLALEARKQEGQPVLDEAAARKWWEGIRNERYATDVFD